MPILEKLDIKMSKQGRKYGVAQIDGKSGLYVPNRLVERAAGIAIGSAVTFAKKTADNGSGEEVTFIQAGDGPAPVSSSDVLRASAPVQSGGRSPSSVETMLMSYAKDLVVAGLVKPVDNKSSSVSSAVGQLASDLAKELPWIREKLNAPIPPAPAALSPQ